MKLSRKPRTWPRLAVLAFAICASSTALAGPADTVYRPIVEKGETEFELRSGYYDFGQGSKEYGYLFAIGYGVTDRWKTEIGFEHEGEDGFGGKLTVVEWENVFVLTEQGKHWVDVGLFLEYEHTFAEGPDELKIGPMFEKQVGSTIANLNLVFEREVGSGASRDTDLDYTWQVKWQGRPELEWGLQGFGGLGHVNDLGGEDEHSIGPALFGVKRLASGNKVSYDAAVLGGINSAAPDLTLRFKLEYEMY